MTILLPPGKLQSGEIDAFFCTAGLRTTIIEELAQQCPIKFLSISDSCSKKLESATILMLTIQFRRILIPDKLKK